MSETKVMTIENLKEDKPKTNKVILNDDEYINIINRIYELQDESDKVSDDNYINQQEILLLKNEIKNLSILCKNYKAEINNKDDKENANKSIKEMVQNQKELVLKLLTTLIEADDEIKKLRREIRYNKHLNKIIIDGLLNVIKDLETIKTNNE